MKHLLLRIFLIVSTLMLAVQMNTQAFAQTAEPPPRADSRKDVGKDAGKDVGKRDGKAAPADKPPTLACENFTMAQNAAYAPFIKLVIDELPDPKKFTDPATMERDLMAIYTKYMQAAEKGDIDAARKATALELFAAQIKHQPAANDTQRKLCALASAGDRARGLNDTLACAVAMLDGTRREQPGNKERARSLLERAKTQISANANAADPAKLLYDDVMRGLAGCY